ncbi:MAG: mechanosensitive ion channel [Myxococcales bacterium]|nr:mechanosensitive ion channel [Myxococcales bacterium]
MSEQLQAFLEEPSVVASIIVLGSVVLAYVIEMVISRTLVVMARKTATDLDDHVIEAVRRPIFLSVIFVGLGLGTDALGLPDGARFAVMAGLKTVAVFVWMVAAIRIGSRVITSVGNHPKGSSVLQPRTIPVFDMLMKIVVVALAIYFVFVAWHVDLTAWLASAGILGIAVGFAAKDTLGNLFAGISILADAPYKLGDWIIIDGTIRGNLRGRVTHIGVRSTRILTRDDVEITVPNAMVANAQLINEMGGPDVKQRVRIAVDVAYGSDIVLTRRVLEECGRAEPLAAKEPAPTVRFRSFGNSGLSFELLVWLEDPGMRGILIDRLNVAIYQRFAEVGLEIPYSKHDVYIKQMPEPRPPAEP